MSVPFSRSIRRMSLVALLVLSGVFAACNGGLGNGDDDDDDDDGTNTPPPQDACTVVWAEEAGGALDVFLVDGPIGDWETGPVTYDVSTVIGVLYDDAPYYEDHVPPRVAAGAAITTSGLFQLTLGDGTQEGGSVVLTDDPPAGQTLFSLDLETGAVGAVVGTATGMTFVGTWSDPDPDQPLTAGAGTVNVLYLGSDLEIGAAGAYAVCYSSTDVASATSSLRIRRTLDRVVRQHAEAGKR